MNWARTALLFTLAGSAGAVHACAASSGSDPAPQACAPGQQVNCGCPGGVQGTQVCLSDGSGYGACACPDAGTGANGAGGSGATGASGGAGNAGGTSQGGTSQGGTSQGGAGGTGLGGGGSSAGGGGGGTVSCSASPFPQGLPDLPSCVGDGAPCDAGSGANTGSCVDGHCFPLCNGNTCPSPTQCVTIDGAQVCASLVSCGSRCNLTKGALCASPAVCITTQGDSYGQCLLDCVANGCPYDAGSQEMSCLVEAGGDWFCGFVCDTAPCPDEYDCATAPTPDQCEPQQT